MTSSRLSIQDCLNIGRQASHSEYVVIDKDSSKPAMFELAYEGGFLDHKGGSFYVCKRIVATNLSLDVIGDYPSIIK